MLPHQTRVLNLRADFADGQQFANSQAVGISLSHSGVQSALIARAMVADAVRGYSQVVPFLNPRTAKSARLDGAGLHLENVQGERLAPVVVVRNANNTEATVSARVPYTRIDGTRAVVNLPESRLRADEIKLLDVREVLQRAAAEPIKTAGIEIEYDSAPGSVIAQVQSVSSNRNQVFRTLLWDAQAQRSSTGGYPFLIEGTSNTKAYIKNATTRAQEYVAFVTWEAGGIYMLGLRRLAARETAEIDVKKLRDEQTPDEEGRTIPLSINKGQIQWMLRERLLASGSEAANRLTLVGQAEQIDEESGMSSAYFCQNCCDRYVQETTIEPETREVEIGESTNFQAIEYIGNCYGFLFRYRVTGSGNTSNLVWSTSDTSVATVSQTGVVTTVSAGDVTIDASWQSRIAYSEQLPNCGGGPFLIGRQETYQTDEKKNDDKDDSEASIIPSECYRCNSSTEGQSAGAALAVIPKVVSITSPNATGNIQSTTQKAMLGATIPFRTSVTGTGPNGIYEWKLEGNVVGENSSALNHAVTALGNHTLTVTYRVGNSRSRPKTVTINVTVPEVSTDPVFLEQSDTSVVQGHGCFGFFDPRYYITTGCTETIRGAIITAWIKDPGNYISNRNESRIKILQIVNTYTTRTNTSTGSCEVLTRRNTTLMEWMLDDSDPYGAPTTPAVGTIEIGSGPNIETNDTPYVRLPDGMNISVDDRFETYLVYFTDTNEQPLNEKAIGVVEWSYGGSSKFISATNIHEEVPGTLFPTNDVRLKARGLVSTNQGTGIRQYDRTRVQTLNNWRPCGN